MKQCKTCDCCGKPQKCRYIKNEFKTAKGSKEVLWQLVDILYGETGCKYWRGVK